MYDDDDNGLISKENLIRCADNVEEFEDQLTKEEAGEMIRMGDGNRKGGVDLTDFMRLMKELGLYGTKKDE